ncbi:MAG: DUF4175 family protein [Planctomycetaceae bacterium]
MRLSADTGTNGASATESTVLTPLSADPRTVTGRVQLTTDGEYSLTLRGINGGEFLEPLTGRVTVVADQPPRVVIDEPRTHVIAVENWTVPVVIEAIDDIGVDRLSLSRSVNDWGPSTIDLSIRPQRPGVVRAEAVFDLAALGAKAGDVITYYATARDNHPQPPHFADSETCVIQVISQEDYTQFARQQYQLDDLAAELEAIRERLERAEEERQQRIEELSALEVKLADNPVDASLEQQVEEQLEELRKHQEALEELAKELEDRAAQDRLYDVEQPYNEMLREVAEQLTQQGEQAAAVSEALNKLRELGSTPATREQLAQAIEQLRREQAGLEQQAAERLQAAQEDLELYQLADNMLAQTERLQGVIQQQRELANRLGELQNEQTLTPEQQQRADQLARQQELLEQDLNDIREQLQQAADAAGERLPEMSASAQQLCQQIGAEQIGADQQQAASEARSGQGREAHEHADSAAEKLESLQCPSCAGGAGECASGLDGPLKLSEPGVSNTLQQLSQGRSIPGLKKPGGESQQPGQQPGDGASGSNGQSGDPQAGQGEQPGEWRPGQSFPGSQTQMPILGPRMELQQPQDPQTAAQLGQDERGGFVPGTFGEDAAAAEQITAEARDGQAGSAGILRGVPVPYRKEAEAYFRRIAEDEAR